MKSKPSENTEYQLRKGLGYWMLTFAGQRTVFKHEHGAYYVAYLLLNPPEEPMHGLTLALKARAKYEFGSRSVEVADPVKGVKTLVDRDAVFQQRNLGLDEAIAARGLRRKQRQLEAIVEDNEALEAVRREASVELEGIYTAQRSSNWRARDAATKCMHAVRRAVVRFRERLKRAGKQDPVIAGFAAHVEKYLITNRRSVESVVMPVGCFYYEAPAGIRWRG